MDSSDLRDFYETVFGWQRDEALSYGDYSVGRIGAGELTAATGTVADWQANSATFYIRVEDIDETVALIERLGGRAIMPKQVGPDDFPSRHINVFTKFVDPAGNVIGLVEAAR